MLISHSVCPLFCINYYCKMLSGGLHILYSISEQNGDKQSELWAIRKYRTSHLNELSIFVWLTRAYTKCKTTLCHHPKHLLLFFLFINFFYRSQTLLAWSPEKIGYFDLGGEIHFSLYFSLLPPPPPPLPGPCFEFSW